ncbi:dihydrodipicolinate synthase family protein [Brevibacterium pityocampae]|uniref:Dihydrodipicolinate synthase family protein n=2 Tax=Brevibacteriaceae TaxID=85019 RepID=A0ABP8J1G8_9MICO
MTVGRHDATGHAMTPVPHGPFHGLSAFPLTPLRDDVLDAPALRGLVGRLAPAPAAEGADIGPALVDSIGALGSTGSYAYLDREEWTTALRTILAGAGGTPVVAGVGALRTREVLARARTAEQLGAAGLLLAPVSYQPLRDSEVIGLFAAVAEAVDLPICIYDNPGTTGFRFSLDLYARLSGIPSVTGVKIPPTDGTEAQPAERLARIREAVGPDAAIGISGDAAAAAHLAAGADAWHSVVGGLFPRAARTLFDAARSGASDTAHDLEELWPLLAQHGSVRVMAAAAAELDLVADDCLPHPLRPLEEDERAEVARTVRGAGLA